MLDDNLKPRDAINRAGLGYTPGTNNYSRLLKKRARLKKQRVNPLISSTNTETNSTRVMVKENTFMNLVLSGKHKCKDAMKLSGLKYKPRSQEYKTIRQKSWRLRQHEEFLQAKKKDELAKAKQAKILEHKFTSVQQYRHEANRAVALAEEAFAEARAFQKQNLELHQVAEAARQR